MTLPAATGLDGHEAVILLFLQPRVGTTGRPVPDRRTTAATPAGTRVSSLAASGTTGRQRAPVFPGPDAIIEHPHTKGKKGPAEG